MLYQGLELHLIGQQKQTLGRKKRERWKEVGSSEVPKPENLGLLGEERPDGGSTVKVRNGRHTITVERWRSSGGRSKTLNLEQKNHSWET